MARRRVTPTGLAKKHLWYINDDEARLAKIDRYIRGEHDLPYMPDTADAEYRLLANRAVSNWSPLVIGTVAQSLYVDAHRPGKDSLPREEKGSPTSATTHSPQWTFWQRNRLDGRQATLYRSALGFGQAFVGVHKGADGLAVVKLYSAMHSSALWRDPANDESPYSFFTIEEYPNPTDNERGIARMWDEEFEYELSFQSEGDVRVVRKAPHGASSCPIVRFAPHVGLEGEVTGLVEPMIPLQDRINQTVFDLLVAQTYSSFKVRTVAGMAPPVEMEAVEIDGPDGKQVVMKPKIDPNTGQPVPKPINLNAKRLLIAKDKDAKFGTLDETPLDGFIESIDMSIRHLSAIQQIPPHHLLGQIANLSAEALAAAETSLSRKIEEFRKTFGESWERVFRLASELEGIPGADDYHSEVVWRDVGAHSLAQTADGLGKLAEALDIPKRGLWPRVSGVSQGEIDRWTDLYEEDQAMLRAAERLAQNTAGRRPRPPASNNAGAEE